jgi:hypothetical protein
MQMHQLACAIKPRGKDESRGTARSAPPAGSWTDAIFGQISEGPPDHSDLMNTRSGVVPELLLSMARQAPLLQTVSLARAPRRQ